MQRRTRDVDGRTAPTPDPTSEPPPARLDSLTSLRFLAAAFVVMGHVETSGTYTAPALEHVFAFPFAAVTFFFVLSGFVLVWSWRPGTSPSGFYLRRFARVWPLYALITVLLLPIGWLIRYPSWDLGQYLLVWGVVLLALQGLCPLSRVQEAVNPPNWSLSCEAFFYLLFPWMRNRLAGLAPRVLNRLAVALVVMTTAVWIFEGDAAWAYFYSGGRVEPMRYIPALVHLPEFVLGMVLAFQVRKGLHLRTRPWQVGVAVAGWMLLVALLHWTHPAWFPMSIDAVAELTAIPLSYLAIATYAGHELAGRRTVLCGTWFVRLGDWSYALYLVNLTVIHVVFMSLGSQSYGGWNALVGVGLLALAVLISGGLHRFVERPAQRFVLRRAGPRTEGARV